MSKLADSGRFAASDSAPNTDRAKILAALAEQPGTSYDVHADTQISLKTCCAHLHQLHAEKRIARSEAKVRLRHRSPGAYVYSIAPTAQGITL